MKTILLTFSLASVGLLSALPAILPESEAEFQADAYPKSMADYGDFKDLVMAVEEHRSQRLLSLDEFLEMSKAENTVILDTRSADRYARKHLKGAIHLSFTDFTQGSLREALPSGKDTRILIYCNNNFEGDQLDFASKAFIPSQTEGFGMKDNSILSGQKPIMLALNIPTFINLVGYGYHNIYELDEMVHIEDPRIQFEGTEVH